MLVSNPVLDRYVLCFDCDLKRKVGTKYYCPHSGSQPLDLIGGCILGQKRAKIRLSNVSISEEKHGG